MLSILVAEDDATVRETVGSYLRRAGHDVRLCADGGAALAAFTQRPADVVVLDLMLPVMDGYEVLRRLRTLRPDQPVILLTARGLEHERVHGLQSGADDYVTKPFSLRELDLRIRAVLRRRTAPAPGPVETTVTTGDLVVDLVGRRVLRAGTDVVLTGREFDLLAWFVRNPGVVAARERLIREVWGWNAGDESTVTVHVRRLREKVEDDPARPARLVTVFGRGYRWDPPASAGAAAQA